LDLVLVGTGCIAPYSFSGGFVFSKDFTDMRGEINALGGVDVLAVGLPAGRHRTMVRPWLGVSEAWDRIGDSVGHTPHGDHDFGVRFLSLCSCFLILSYSLRHASFVQHFRRCLPTSTMRSPQCG